MRYHHRTKLMNFQWDSVALSSCVVVSFAGPGGKCEGVPKDGAIGDEVGFISAERLSLHFPCTFNPH